MGRKRQIVRLRIICVVYDTDSQTDYFILSVNAIEIARSGDLLDVLFFCCYS